MYFIQATPIRSPNSPGFPNPFTSLIQYAYQALGSILGSVLGTTMQPNNGRRPFPVQRRNANRRIDPRQPIPNNLRKRGRWIHDTNIIHKH